MADKNASNSKIGSDSKSKMIKDLFDVPTSGTLLSDIAALVGKHNLCYKKELAVSYEKSDKIKHEPDVLSEMDNTVGDKSSMPSLKIRKIVLAPESTPSTIKKEITSNEKAKEKCSSIVPAYTSTPIRTTKVLTVQTGEANSDNSGNPTSADTNEKEDDNIIRLTSKNLSDEERKKLRAKRFNIIVADSYEKKVTTNTVCNPVYGRTSTSTNEPTPTYNILKKRAQRFGENVSTVMKSLEYKERLLKRKLKFLESVTNLKELEIKKKRAERFRVISRV